MRKILIILGVSTLAFGCSKTPTVSEDNSYSDNYTGIEEGKLFVAPVRLEHEGLEAGGEKVIEEMAKQLRACEWDVATMSRENYQSVWSDIVQSIDGIYSPSTGQLIPEKYHHALKELVESVNREEVFSATLIPSLVLKRAEIKGGFVRWDGAKRKKVVSKLPGSANMSGSTRGLSLEVMSFGPQADWLFTSFGGLVLPFHTTVRDGKPVNEVRQEMFEKDDDIASGVGVALHPITKGDLCVGS